MQNVYANNDEEIFLIMGDINIVTYLHSYKKNGTMNTNKNVDRNRTPYLKTMSKLTYGG